MGCAGHVASNVRAARYDPYPAKQMISAKPIDHLAYIFTVRRCDMPVGIVATRSDGYRLEKHRAFERIQM